MAGRASIVGAAETSVGKVREHNEDSHFIDPEEGIFIVCDGMGGHAAGEVASALAVKTIRSQWSGTQMQTVADRWLAQGTPELRKQLIATVTNGVLAAHDAIVKEAERDKFKKGMGTTVVAAIVVGGDVVFAHCGDSRAYMVRDGITVQLTEDHTLLARLLAAGVDVDVNGDGMRFKSMLTNALGIGHECKVSTFVVPVADGDRFVLCSDGITEYLEENEIGEVLTTMPSPARAAQRLVEIALARGGGDNATALVVRVLEAGETARPAEQLRREEQAIYACPLWAKVNTQQRLRALRIALPRDHAMGERIPANTLGDRVAWILVEGEVEQDGHLRGPGSLLYPEALLSDRPLPDKDGLAITQSEVRALALRSDDFKELCEDDPEIGEHLLGAIALEISRRRPHRTTGKVVVHGDGDPGRMTDPEIATANTLEQKIVKPPAPPATAPPPAADIGKLDTLQRPAVEPPADIGRADTLRRPAVQPPPDVPPPVTPSVLAAAAIPPLPRPPASPPAVRAKSSTNVGAPVPDRLPAIPMDDAWEAADASPQLISTPAETAAALDVALDGMTHEAPLPPSASTSMAAAPRADDEMEISVEVDLDAPPPTPPTPRRASTKGGAKAAEPPPTPPHHSDPEISISELSEKLQTTKEQEAEKYVQLTVDDNDSAKVVEILQDTSSSTIMLSVDEDDGDEVASKSR